MQLIFSGGGEDDGQNDYEDDDFYEINDDEDDYYELNDDEDDDDYELNDDDDDEVTR